MHYATKSMLLDAVRNLPRTIYNLIGASRVSPYEMQLSLVRNMVLSMAQEDRGSYIPERKFVLDVPLDKLNEIMFPYEVKPEFKGWLQKCDIQIGREGELPYVMHDSEMKVYYPASTSDGELMESYRNLMYVEGITGAGVLEKSPHCYQDAEFRVEHGDCLLDIGCAEALFALDNIDKVRKAFLFEFEPFWQRPLKHTFQPYSDKVQIVRKMVSDHTSKTTTRIMDAIDGDMGDMYRCRKFFVKMDVEGCERMIIKGNEDFFKDNKVKLSCCVYHRQDDGVVIKDMLEHLGYTTRYSDGYMLVGMNGIHFPYFRHGVIYAQNY